MLAASSDLTDMMHEHPFIADRSPQMECDVVFRGQARVVSRYSFRAMVS